MKTSVHIDHEHKIAEAAIELIEYIQAHCEVEIAARTGDAHHARMLFERLRRTVHHAKTDQGRNTPIQTATLGDLVRKSMGKRSA